MAAHQSSHHGLAAAAAAQLYRRSRGSLGQWGGAGRLREIEEEYRTADLTHLAAELHVSLPISAPRYTVPQDRTFKDLLLEKRLSKAAQLLRETRLTTQDIILAVGYENTSYFYRVFRSRYGVTPRDYRRDRGGDFLSQEG